MTTHAPRPPLHLRRHAHAVRVEEVIVLLDIAADRYLCLPGAVADLSADRRCITLSDPQLVDALVQSGLADWQADQPAGAGRTAERPTASWVRYDDPPPKLSDVGPAARAVADLLLTYRGKPFARILETARPGRPPVPPAADLERVVRAFHRWVPFAPVSAKCLLRSFMLLRHLRRHGHDAVWVFGVATWPFRAHCWLQVGAVVLDDELERVQAFTPIFVQ